MEREIKQTLTGIRQAMKHLLLYPVGHPLVDETIASASRAADALAAGEGGEVVVTLLDDAFYVGPQVIAHTSLEFNAMLREMQARGVDSITFIEKVQAEDMIDFAAFVAGIADDLPAGGSIRLNDRPLALTPTETKLLYILMQNAGKTVLTNYILGRVWANQSADENTLRVHIHRLRQKIEVSPSRPRYVVTERGAGYSFLAPSEAA